EPSPPRLIRTSPLVLPLTAQSQPSPQPRPTPGGGTRACCPARLPVGSMCTTAPLESAAHAEPSPGSVARAVGAEVSGDWAIGLPVCASNRASAPDDELLSQMPAGPAATRLGLPPTANLVRIPVDAIRTTVPVAGNDTQTSPPWATATPPGALPRAVTCSFVRPELIAVTSLDGGVPTGAPAEDGEEAGGELLPPVAIRTAATPTTTSRATAAAHTGARRRRRPGTTGLLSISGVADRRVGG